MSIASRHLRFTADFRYKPTPQSAINYKAGQVAFVRLACAERALAAGKAEVVQAEPADGMAATIGKKKRAPRKRVDVGK